MKLASEAYRMKHGAKNTFVKAKEDVLAAAEALWENCANGSQNSLPDPFYVDEELGMIGGALSSLYQRSETLDQIGLLRKERDRALGHWFKLTGLDATLQANPPGDLKTYELWRNYCLALSVYQGFVATTLREMIPYRVLEEGDRVTLRTFNLPERTVPAERKSADTPTSAAPVTSSTDLNPYTLVTGSAAGPSARGRGILGLRRERRRGGH